MTPSPALLHPEAEAVRETREPARRWKNVFYVLPSSISTVWDEDTGEEFYAGEYEDFRTHPSKETAEAFAAGMMRAAELVGKRAHMSELMDRDTAVAVVLRYMEAGIQQEAAAIRALPKTKED